MTSQFTTATADAILTAEFKTATIYGALFLASPGDAGSVVSEVADANCYTRKEITCGTDATARSISNTSALTFDAASGGAWGTITDLGVMESTLLGDDSISAYGSLTASKTVSDTDQLVFAIGNITAAFAAGA